MTLVGVPAPLLSRIPHLARFLEPWGQTALLGRGTGSPKEISAIAGWGRDHGKLTLRAQDEALHLGVPYLAIEHGFLRSISSSHADAPVWDIIADDVGIYYTTKAPSRFLNLAKEAAIVTENTIGLLKMICQQGPLEPRFPGGTPLVMVLDQIASDPSIRGAAAAPDDFEAMLDAAVAENPGAEIRVQLDLNGIASAERGILSRIAESRHLAVSRAATDWFTNLRQAKRVYTVTSLGGLDALVLKVPVISFGAAFYAGLGFTDDRVQCGSRTPLSFESFAHVAYERYPRYVDPVHERVSNALVVAGRLAALRQKNEETASPAFVHGVSRWKQPFITPFIAGKTVAPRYVSASKRTARYCAETGGRLMTWAAREPEWLAETAQAAGLTLSRIEDGFIRSIGLGSNFTPALSLVIDDLGIYFDPSRESRLERILNTEETSPALLNAARLLRAQMIEGRFSKYNMEAPPDRHIPMRQGARVILVPGQVEDDASIRLGSPIIKTNLGLIRAVREGAPDAVIIYKPHPDVESGNRPGIVLEQEALEHADTVIAGWDAPSALEAVA